MENNILTPVSESKFYKKQTILICTFLAGPLVGGYMIAENFKGLGEKQNQLRALLISSAFTIGLILSLVLMPFLEKVPGIIFPALSTVIASACVQFFQIEKIRSNVSNGGSFYKNERAFVVSIIGLVITIAFALIIAILSEWRTLS
ncbi:MAG TPA: hypothetical protein VKT28_12340 [Puia sp.]|nr:hypothetical protein [Puia sp.]